MRNFLASNRVERCMNAQAAGVTTLNGSAVANEGARSVTYQVALGAVVDGTASSVKLQQGELADSSDMADVSGATYTIVNDDDNKVVTLELIKPTKAYSRVVVVRATQNVTVDGAIAILNHERINPVSQPTTTVGKVVKQG